MLKISLLLAVMLFVAMPHAGFAQDATQRTRDLVAALDKTKYKKKEKANISIEIYIEIRNEPVVRPAADYAGNYEAEDGSYRLTLNIAGGSVAGSGYDGGSDGQRRASFSLKNATISGALLSATKAYDNGEERPFEAVFVNRTVAGGKNVNEITSRDTRFGLGFIQSGNWKDDSSGKTENWTSRVFLERR